MLSAPGPAFCSAPLVLSARFSGLRPFCSAPDLAPSDPHPTDFFFFLGGGGSFRTLIGAILGWNDSFSPFLFFFSDPPRCHGWTVTLIFFYPILQISHPGPAYELENKVVRQICSLWIFLCTKKHTKKTLNLAAKSSFRTICFPFRFFKGH